MLLDFELLNYILLLVGTTFGVLAYLKYTGKNNKILFNFSKYVLILLVILNLANVISYNVDKTEGNTSKDSQKPIDTDRQQDSDEELEQEVKSESIFKDGIFTGVADGFGPNLTVEIEIKNNVINRIEIFSHNEQQTHYFMPAFDSVPEQIIETQSVNVDSVTGSTYSSYGIMNAVNDALSKALISGELEEVNDIFSQGKRGHGH